MLPQTALTLAPLAVLSVGLSVTVSTLRGRLGIALGDGGNPRLALWIRRHANLMENAPLALLAIAVAEANGAAAAVLSLACVILVVSRLVHPFGVHADRPAHPLRVIGGVGTHAAMLIAAAAALL